MSPAPERDVLVLGAGPAGATVAAHCARSGLSVTMIDPDAGPGYRIGESLIPFCYFPLERLGVLEAIEAAGFVEKHSVQFISESGRRSTPFYFGDHLDHPAAVTWQVPRDRFDAILRDQARADGVEVREGLRATELLQEEGRVVGVRVTGPDEQVETLRARLVVDATGRVTFAARALGWRVREPALDRVSVWTYFAGAHRDPGRDEGATTIAYLPEKGWAWYIPLPDDRVSVGVVARKDWLFEHHGEPGDAFEAAVRHNPWVTERLAPGTRVEDYRVTGDYAYRARHCAADGLVLVGDAFSFMDPVFSSGVFLALTSGELAAEAIREALAQGEPTADRFRAYGERFMANIEAMRRLIHAFYHPDFNFGALVARHPELQGLLTDCLIGNVETDLEPLFRAMKELAALPDPIAFGGPEVSP